MNGPAAHGVRVSGDYDILVLDASYKQTLVSTRSFGRAGLRVALGECFVECDPALPVLAFQSRHSARNVVLPSYAADPSAFADAVVKFVREHPTRVVLPTGDRVIAALMPERERFTALGCVLALAPNSALALARISTQRIWPPSLLAELEAQAAVLPPGDGGVGTQLGLAQDG